MNNKKTFQLFKEALYKRETGHRAIVHFKLPGSNEVQQKSYKVHPAATDNEIRRAHAKLFNGVISRIDRVKSNINEEGDGGAAVAANNVASTPGIAMPDPSKLDGKKLWRRKATTTQAKNDDKQ